MSDYAQLSSTQTQEQKGRWGCVCLLKREGLYRLQTVQRGQDLNCEPLLGLLRTDHLVHVIFTDNVPYILDKLRKRFAWEAVSYCEYALKPEDVAYVRSVHSHPPMIVLHMLLPQLSYQERYRLLHRLQETVETVETPAIVQRSAS